MAEAAPEYVLDSFALLAYFQGEPAGAPILELMTAARDGTARLHLSLINAGEIYYILYRERGPSAANEMLDDLRDLPVELAPATKDRILAAARLKAQHPISYADAFAAALAQELNATLVTGDPEFKSVEAVVPVRWLPRN
jgi:predicted nucleic acid-binding protein